MPRRGNLCGCPAIASALVVIVNLNIRNPHGSGSTIVTLLHEKINRKIDRYFPLVIIANCVDSLLTMETAGKCFQKILKGE